MNNVNKRPLLSICIPTFNGASSYIDYVINYALKAANNSGEIEVIVSDNASTDNTETLLEKYLSNPYFSYFRNKENIGFNRNMLLLTDKYARGEYCWIIGDDDIINPYIVPEILQLLRKREIDFLSLRFNRIIRSKIDTLSFSHFKIQAVYANFPETIDENCIRGNSLATFIAASIFRSDPFKAIKKDFITNAFDTSYNIFPNSYLLALAFNKSKCAFIKQEVLTVGVHEKFWGTEEKLYLIDSKIMVELFKHFMDQGINESQLLATKKRIIYDNIMWGYRRLLNFKPVSAIFYKSIYESVKYPVIHINILKKILNSIITMIGGKVNYYEINI